MEGKDEREEDRQRDKETEGQGDTGEGSDKQEEDRRVDKGVGWDDKEDGQGQGRTQRQGFEHNSGDLNTTRCTHLTTTRKAQGRRIGYNDEV